MKLFGFLLSAVKPEDKNLNQLIFDVAEYHREADKVEVFRRLPHLELFARVVHANFELQNGTRIKLEKGMELQIDTVKLQGKEFVRFLVNKDDPRLGANFVGMSVAEVFDMVERDPQMGGLIFYNDKESYFGVPREELPFLRNRYLS